MAFGWSTTSLINLKGIHPDLRKVCNLTLAMSPVDFRIVDGLRTLEEQKQNVKRGKSQTLRSRHLTGHAIDFVVLTNGNPDWFAITKFKQVGAAFKKASLQLKIPITWGGDWKSLRDYGHIELTWAAYPVK